MVHRRRMGSWRWGRVSLVATFLVVSGGWLLLLPSAHVASQSNDDFSRIVRPFLQRFCLECHSTQRKKGSLDLEQFTSVEAVRKEIKRWQQVLELVESGEMPPEGQPQPASKEKQEFLRWLNEWINQEARQRAGDPGHVPLRRLSNAEYDQTIADLTGIAFHPAREFPADGAAGEGFTNAAEALSDMSPTMLDKYLKAAKNLSEHVVLLPGGFRFSSGKTRRDWTDESSKRLRQFYAQHAAPEGKLLIEPYLIATIRHRDALEKGQMTLPEVARQEKLNVQYLTHLWHALQAKAPSMPMDWIRARWRTATLAEGPQLVNEIAAWQQVLWKTANVGNYLRPSGQDYVDSFTKQYATDPKAVEQQKLSWPIQPTLGESEIILHLSARELHPASENARVVWHQPRFEAPQQAPLMLKDYDRFRAEYEVDRTTLFSESARYLHAVAEHANDPLRDVGQLASHYELDEPLLRNWIDLLALDANAMGQLVPAVDLQLLDEKVTNAGGKPSIHGWRKKGMELPIVLANASDVVEHIPGTIAPHQVVMHPTPDAFVAVVWKSPISGKVQIASSVAHTHPAGGNGVSWWIEHRHAGQAKMLLEGSIPRGGAVNAPTLSLMVAKDDWIMLAVDARNRDHTFDTTTVNLAIKLVENPTQTWDLATQLADRIQDGNPQPDALGQPAVWSFVLGPSRPVGASPVLHIPYHSLLGRWRSAVLESQKKESSEELARQVQTCLTAPRSSIKDQADLALYDLMLAPECLLFRGVKVAKLGKALPQTEHFGWKPTLFGGLVDEESVCAPANGTLELRLPASLLQQRTFVVEGRIHEPSSMRVVQFHISAPSGQSGLTWPPPQEVAADAKGAGYKQLQKGAEEFRQLFPLFTCFPLVIPNDEVVSLKMFHREDEPLMRLFLDEAQTKELNALWLDHDFIGQQAIAENKFLPQFIGYTTQDAPPAIVAFFENRRPVFQQRADALERALEAAIPKQLDALMAFAARAFRRPLSADERADLLQLYQSLRQQGVPHEEAFRGVLTRILVAPAFLFRMEKAPPGQAAAAIDDWELAARLSYFLWSSMPDEELRSLAASGQLHQPNVLQAQMQRMLQDARARSLAIEFGTQWLHVRHFDAFQEKNEKLFPTFNAELRMAMYEEAIRFFQDFFQADRPVLHLLNADATFLNELLAHHYGIPDVAGPAWRRVENVQRYGRGGVLGLGCVLAKQSGASRTSPILRGNWIVETLLGEKLPRPPANVPTLPEMEGVDSLSMRQIVERHTRQPECAACHVRIDPFGFAFEKYDAIGRRRETYPNGTPLNAHARLKDGTEFTDVDGLRHYLLTQKQDVFVRLFCKKLLGYALGRATTLADQSVIDQMVQALKQNDGRISAAMQVILLSPQFRMIRGAAFTDKAGD